MRTTLIFILLVVGLHMQLSGQHFLQLNFPKHQLQNKNISIKPSLFPQSQKKYEIINPERLYETENPAQYAWLCLLELEIERKWPVGIWIKTGEAQSFETVAPTKNAAISYMQFKLWRF